MPKVFRRILPYFNSKNFRLFSTLLSILIYKNQMSRPVNLRGRRKKNINYSGNVL